MRVLPAWKLPVKFWVLQCLVVPSGCSDPFSKSVLVSVQQHTCVKELVPHKSVREELLERDFRQHKGLMRSNSPLVSFKAPSWAGVLRMEGNTLLKGAVWPSRATFKKIRLSCECPHYEINEEEEKMVFMLGSGLLLLVFSLTKYDALSV